MHDDQKDRDESSSLMATVAAIVESVLARQGVSLTTPKPSAWKAAHRSNMARTQTGVSMEWGRLGL